MPAPRQRIVFCDCLDCVEQPSRGDLPASASPASEAAARQEPPPKCLLLVLAGALVELPLPSSRQQQQQQQQQQQPGADGGSGDDDDEQLPRTALDAAALPHLHRAAAHGSLCLLTQRAAAPADPAAELAQLLGVYDGWRAAAGYNEDGSISNCTQLPTLQERFKGMQAALASTSPEAQRLAAAAGLAASGVLLDPDAGDGGDGESGGLLQQFASSSGRRPRRRGQGDLGSGGGGAGGGGGGGGGAAEAPLRLPDEAEAARRVLEELAVDRGDAGLDMLVVHVDACGSGSGGGSGSSGGVEAPAAAAAAAAAQQAAALQALAWADRVVRLLNASAPFRDATLLAVVATPGRAALSAAPPTLAAAGGAPLTPGVAVPCRSNAGRRAAAAAAVDEADKGHSALPPPPPLPARTVPRPLQSWEQLGGAPLAVAPRRPMLCLRRLPGVVRRDDAACFTLRAACAAGGDLAIVADRLLPELAYKLGRAPKYGA